MVFGSQDSDSKFSHLLLPIRDLTKNWNIDLAGDLEDYLDELEKIQITFDGGATIMNFSEAALIIQGSACVYGKKVEYLFSLVHEVLGLLANKKKSQKNAEKNDHDNDQTVAQKDEDEFLCLDDDKMITDFVKKFCQESEEFRVDPVPKTPLYLARISEGQKCDMPILGHKGEMLGGRSDFTINKAVVHVTGSALVDFSNINFANMEVSLGSDLAATACIMKRVTFEMHHSEPADDMELDHAAPPDMDHSMDDHDDGGGVPADDMMSPEGETHEDKPQEVKEYRRSEREKKNAEYFKPPEKIKMDPWESLDAHDEKKSQNKPLRKSRSFRIPHILMKEGDRKRKRQGSETDNKDLIPITEFFSKNFKSGLLCPRHPFKALTLPEFDHLYFPELRRRQGCLRQARKILALQGNYEELAEEEEEERQNNDLPEPDDDDDLELPEMSLGGVPLDELCDVSNAHSDPLFPPEEDNDLPVVSSYEELVQKYVDGFMASAQQYAQITELSQRVTMWEDKILPTLSQEEEREPFDIHRYSGRILGGFDDVQKTVKDKELMTFRELVENKPKYEVCRMFLSTLMLANNYNVEIGSNGGQMHEAVDSMTVKLLSTRLRLDDLEEYHAPSVTTKPS